MTDAQKTHNLIKKYSFHPTNPQTINQNNHHQRQAALTMPASNEDEGNISNAPSRAASLAPSESQVQSGVVQHKLSDMMSRMVEDASLLQYDEF